MTKLEPGDAILGSVSMISILIGLPLNLTMLTYFFTYTGKRTLSYMLYVLVCITDIIIITSHLPTTLCYFDDRNPILFASHIFCSVWGLVWNTAMRVSVFIIAVLCVSRMIAVVFPLKKLARRGPLYLVLGYILMMLVQSSTPFWFGTTYEYNRDAVTCYDYNFYGFAHYLVVGVLEFMVPLLVVLPAGSISIWSICKSKKQETMIHDGVPRHRNRAKNSATITMILLTSAYFLFNAPLVLYTILGFLKILTGTALFDSILNTFHGIGVEEKGRYHLMNFSFSISVCLNSTTNAIVYTSRSSAIKKWIRRIPSKCTRLDSKVSMRILRSENYTNMVKLQVLETP